MVDDSITDALVYWAEYAGARKRLREREYCRSNKDPEAEFAEWLVAHLLPGGRLVDNRSFPGYDVVAADRRIQVKKYGKLPGNKNPMAPGLEVDPERRPTHYAFVDFHEGLPVAVYICSYEWVAENCDQRGGLPIVKVREVGDQPGVIEVYPIPSDHIGESVEKRLERARGDGRIEWSGGRLETTNTLVQPQGEGAISDLLLSMRR